MDNVTFVPEEQVRASVAAAFARHSNTLERTLVGGGVQVEHVGSTSVPGALTKGDLDLLVRVASLEDAVEVLTRTSGYHIHQRENWTPCFASFVASGEADPEVGVQVVRRGERTDRSLRAFPALLRERPDILTRYNALKRAFDGCDHHDYRSAKADFVHAVLPADPAAAPTPPAPHPTIDAGRTSHCG